MVPVGLQTEAGAGATAVTTQTEDSLLYTAVHSVPMTTSSCAASSSAAGVEPVGGPATTSAPSSVSVVGKAVAAKSRPYVAGASTTKPTHVLNECVLAGHRVLTGRNETHAYVSCRSCLFKHSWSAWEEPDFKSFPGVQDQVKWLWDQLVRERRA